MLPPLVICEKMRGLYIHLPFCKNKCPYCHFYSETVFDEGSIALYFNAIFEDLEHVENKSFDTIYLGGGTPSAIPPLLLEKFIQNIISRVNFSHVEFTIEANPESVSDNFILFVKNSPITRVSLGVQNFDDDVLKLLGRIHSAKMAIDAANALKNIDIDLNIDMIFDIPTVPPNKILTTARMLVDLCPAHVSAYSYSAEDRNYLEGFDTDDTMFFEIENFFTENGFFKYETSNFAKKGKESKHNSIYWGIDEYIGVGASAHSMVYDEAGFRIRYSRPADIKTYEKIPLGFEIYDRIAKETAAKESVIIGLRKAAGVNLEDIEKRFGKIDKNLIKNINTFIERGMLEWNEKNIRTTLKGASVLDSLSSALW